MNPVRTPRSVRRAIAAAAVAALGLSACASTPSAKRVAQDTVDRVVAEEGLSAVQRECMLDAIDNYSEDRLEEIAESADAGNPEGVAALAQFEAELAACRR